MKKTVNDSYELILKQTSSKKKNSFFSLRKTYPAYIILVIFLIASVFIRYFAKSNIETSLSNEYNKATTSVLNRISAHYFKQIEVLNSMNGLYDLLVEVVKDYFELYATIPTKSYSSILSVSYIPEVKHADMDKFIVNAKGLGYFNYELKTKEVNDVYYPFVNIVPEFKNYHRLGVDIGDQPQAMDAIYRARDNNRMTATEIYTVRQPDTNGLYIFYPVYFRNSERETLEQRKKNFQAVISLEIKFDLFIKEALSGEGMGQKVTIPSDSSIFFEIVGLSTDNKEYSIYKSENFVPLGSFKPLLTNENKLKFADKEFIIKFYSIPNYGGQFQQLLPDLALVIAIILSFAFFGFVLTQLTNKARAQEIAESMTRSQRRIVDTSNDIIAVLDSELIWKSMNPASLPIFGILPDNMIGSSFSDILEDKSLTDTLKNTYIETKADHTERMDFRMYKKDSEPIWVNWSFTFSVSDGLIYCIGRDITFEKAAEEEAKLHTKQIETVNILSKEANFSKSYFMKEMSHQLRNSLTGIEGSLQALKHKLYDSEEELELYVNLANTSSEELHIYVTDIEDASKANDLDTSDFMLEMLKLSPVLNKCINSCKSEGIISQDSMINISDNIESAVVLADEKSLNLLIQDAILTLGKGTEKINYEINVEINPFEGAVELQILSSANALISEMIELYQKNSNNILDAIKFDKEDALISITRMASTMRLLRGSFKIDTFGPDDGNLISIVFKSNKKSI